MRLGQLRAEAAAALRAAGRDCAEVDSRRILEQATGLGAADLAAAADEPATTRVVALVDRMVARRATGEPLQYVLGRWGFRTLDLMVDERVLIPRPETECVAGHAIDAIGGRSSAVAVDLGTGSGAIALSIAAERWPRVEVWATDVSADALAVASANLAGLGRRAGVVALAEGDWFAALPGHLLGRVDVVVSNPPYVAESDVLPVSVTDWEPRQALVAGTTGLEAIGHIVVEAPRWLAAGGTLVVEIGDSHGEAARELADSAGFADAEVHPDLSGRDRVLVARRASS